MVSFLSSCKGRVSNTSWRTFLLSKGVLTASISLTDKNQFHPGETVRLSWKIENSTNRPIKGASIEIRANVSFLNRGEAQERKIVKVMKRFCPRSNPAFTISRSSACGGRYNIVVPYLPASSTLCMVGVQYCLVMTVVTVFGSSLEVELPVNIGRRIDCLGILGLPPHTDGKLYYC